MSGTQADGMEYLLEALHVTKVFGTLKANDDVTLKVKPGEIHAFLGENGAGKSTLVKMIYGALQPTSGEFRWMGKTVTIPSPAAARKLGLTPAAASAALRSRSPNARHASWNRRVSDAAAGRSRARACR